MKKNTATNQANKKKSTYKLKLRELRLADFERVNELLTLNYDTDEEVWTEKQFETLLKVFPTGQIGIENRGDIVAYALTIIVQGELFDDKHSYLEITNNFTFSTHDSSGDSLYGVDVCIHPEYKGMRLGRRLYDVRKQICEKLNLRGIYAGGRMPNYHNYAKKLKPKEYIEKVKNKEIYDSVLTFQLSNGFHVKNIITEYNTSDKKSLSNATLLEWNNVYYQKKKRIVGTKKSVIRIGLVQWQMRSVKSLESLYENIEFFVDAVSDYQSDFVVFPELFNVPLISEYDEQKAHIAMHKVASYTEKIRDKLVEYAISYNINIIGGSMPFIENDKLFNVSYLCKRDGTWDTQYKIHITPSEVDQWNFIGGNKLKVFDTDVAKIGILVCYDIEFPELGRILADQGVQIVFVPFLTDTQNGYNRVRSCSRARAVENECYVAIAGSVGNLPKVKNMDIQYAQSAVFTPSDFSFPSNSIKAEATPNTEMTVIADVDLDLLKELHSHGSVMNLKDRRTDLYQVKWNLPDDD